MSPAAASSLYVLVGKPVAGNPTQEMLEAAFAAAGLDCRATHPSTSSRMRWRTRCAGCAPWASAVRT